MRNVIEMVEFKLKCARYHFNQSMEASRKLNEENTYIFIAEFCAMMEVIQSGILIANFCAYNQSAIDARSFKRSLPESEIAELDYIEQFLEENRKGNVFEVTDNKEIQIISLAKRKQIGTYAKRSVRIYIKEAMAFAEKIINEFMKICKKSTSYFDQSWRDIDMNRASFLCKECGWPITKLLSHIGNLSNISLKEKEPFISRRSYVYGHELIRADMLPWGGVNEITENEIIVPIDALYFDAKKESAPGCCGPDSSEFNIYCKNGHVVGKEAADCWMPHFARLPFDKVTRNESI